MVVTIFRSRLVEDADMAQLEALGQRMYELASSMPGFRSYEEFTSADGESLTLVGFDDMASLAAWRNHPEHLVVQQQGREYFFADYWIQVCEVERAYRYRRGIGREDVAV